MMTYGPGSRLAFCSPAADRWTPLGKRLSWYKDEEQRVKFAVRPWEDLVHCTASGELIAIQPLTFRIERQCGEFVDDKYGKNEHHCEMHYWRIPEGCVVGDLPLPVSNYDTRSYEEDEDSDVEMRNTKCIQMPHLLCVDEHDYFSSINAVPLIVLRFVNRGIGDNGSPSDQKLARPELYRATINTFPYRSIGFVVLSLENPFCFWQVAKDLKGLAIFVGMNHSFAVPATGNLKPNSIYFTDAGSITPPDPDATKIYGGHEIGVYDYEKNTISPCFYPCDFQRFKRIDPPPMWFTPTFN